MSGTRRRPGSLGPFVEGYRVRLLELGYTPQTVRGMLRVLGQLGRWIDDEGVGLGVLDMAALDAFRAARRAGGDRRVASAGELRQLVRYLREVGVMAPDEAPLELTPLERLLAEYRRWLSASGVWRRRRCIATRRWRDGSSASKAQPTTSSVSSA